MDASLDHGKCLFGWRIIAGPPVGAYTRHPFRQVELDRYVPILSVITSILGIIAQNVLMPERRIDFGNGRWQFVDFMNPK
jgi:hypothetical protein